MAHAIVVYREKFLNFIRKIMTEETPSAFKNQIRILKNVALDPKKGNGFIAGKPNGETVSLRRDVLVKECQQMLESQTLDRAKYYLQRLEKGIREEKTGKINDLNLRRWKEYDDILTDSLWIMGRRDNSGAHIASYWGNFIPQIPNQMIRRYTKKGEWVLDAFAGSGTTLIECRRLGRNGIGLELNENVARQAQSLVEKEGNPHHVNTYIANGDSRNLDLANILKRNGIRKIQHLIMHPPYFDIIKFSADKNDLSNAASVGSFIKMFGEVIDNTAPHLERGRYFSLVIGDKYARGEWVPLGFFCMQEVLKRGFSLKSIVVKNFEETRGKRNQKELWRYRALVGGFYVFKHEYIFVFKKTA